MPPSLEDMAAILKDDLPCDGTDYEEQARKYWRVIRWDAASFLATHDSRNSRLFHDKIATGLAEDLICVARGVAGKVARSAQGFVTSIFRRRRAGVLLREPYLLLIAAGIVKYASEERAVIEACRAQNLAVKAVHPGSTTDTCFDVELLPVASTLTSWDHLRVLAIWLCELIRGSPSCFRRDRKQRNLFVAAIPAMWQYCVYTVFARRIVAEHGAPRLLLSLLSSAPLSAAVVEHMRGRSVLTAAIRTQTTSRVADHLVINTDVLFWKSPHERRAYEDLFVGGGPRLEAGCLLSLPEACSAEPLPLPERYVLLLGTAPTSDQGPLDYGRYNEKLFQVAAAAGLPVIFKGHDLAKDLDDAWFAARTAPERPILRVQDIGRNRELIDRSSLMVSAPSTLLYYAILCGTPVILVESKITAAIPDEFRASPIRRIPWEESAALGRLDWSELQDSARAAKAWFEENYCLQKGADYMVGFLLNQDGSIQRRNPS